MMKMKTTILTKDSLYSLHLHDSRVAIVCSARSTDTKEEGTTTRLMRAAESAMQPGSSQYLSIIEAIRDDHISATNEYVHDEDRRKELISNIEEECSRVAKLLGAAQIIDEISPKTLDSIIGTGEKLACMFMAALLADRVCLFPSHAFCGAVRFDGGMYSRLMVGHSFVGTRSGICQPREFAFEWKAMARWAYTRFLRHSRKAVGR
jgi:hypothetical protein